MWRKLGRERLVIWGTGHMYMYLPALSQSSWLGRNSGWRDVSLRNVTVTDDSDDSSNSGNNNNNNGEEKPARSGLCLSGEPFMGLWWLWNNIYRLLKLSRDHSSRSLFSAFLSFSFPPSPLLSSRRD